MVLNICITIKDPIYPLPNCTVNKCECNDGFEYRGDICEDINECQQFPYKCNQMCINTNGSFKCLCNGVNLIQSYYYYDNHTQQCLR